MRRGAPSLEIHSKVRRTSPAAPARLSACSRTSRPYVLEGHAARTRPPRDQAPTHLRLPTPVGEKPLHWPHVQARALGIAERILFVAGLPEHDGGENEAEGHEFGTRTTPPGSPRSSTAA